MTNENQTPQDDASTQATGHSVADFTSTGDTAAVELNNAIAEGLFPGTGSSLTPGMTPLSVEAATALLAQGAVATTGMPDNYSTAESTPAMYAAAHTVNNENTRAALVKRIVDFDPVEFSNEVSPGRAQFLADAILRDFDIMPKVSR